MLEKNNKSVKNINEVNPITTPNLTNTELYQLVTKDSHGTNFSFNMMKILPKGVVKRQSHSEQHVVFVFNGECSILLGEEWVDAKKGDFIHIPSNLTHSFTNNGQNIADVLILKADA